VIVLEVLLNGKRFARAGTEDMGVLSTHVTGLGKLGPRSRGTKGAPQAYDLDLHVGGLTSRTNRADEHLRWGPRKSLKIGDEVTVRILETRNADAPSRRSPQQGDTRRPSERERYEFAKALYFKLRNKFERRRLTARRTRTRAQASRLINRRAARAGGRGR
jgi:hypothetical protein